MPHILLIIYLAVAVVLQVLTGDFPVWFMVFPLNVITLALWLSAVVLIWTKGRKSLFIRFMLSPSATFWAISLMLAAGLVIGFTGWRGLAFTWVLVAVMLYFQTVLVYVILRGWREATATGARLGAVRWRFLFLHAGLLLTVVSAFWGTPDVNTLRLQAMRADDLPADARFSGGTEAFNSDGTLYHLPYKIVLQDFDLEKCEAEVALDGDPVLLRVNHPHRLSFSDDLYLVSYDVSPQDPGYVRYCVLQIVSDPWRYAKVAGVVMMLAGAFMLFAGGPRRRYSNDLD